MRFVLSCLLLLALAGCQGAPDAAPDAAEASPTAAVDEAAIHDDLAAAFAGDQPGADAVAEGDCFADELLAGTTVDELRGAGILDEQHSVVEAFPELPRELAEKVVDAQLGCTDFVEDSSVAGIHVTKGKVAERRYAACLRRTLPPAQVRDAMLAAVMGEWESPAIERLSSSQGRCARQAER